ncbi:MAG: hypothetical protein AB7R89_20115 [Dehalococcoidia bacterium]
MTSEYRETRYIDDPRIVAAVDELTQLISGGFPDAQIEVSEGDDPDGVYLTVTVDIDDPDEVTELVVDRTMALQIEEELPVYVIPIRPISRVMETRRRRMEDGIRLPSAL